LTLGRRLRMAKNYTSGAAPFLGVRASYYNELGKFQRKRIW
jgi:hypothetical protein